MKPKYIYIILNETDMSGAWDDPREAVKWYFSSDIRGDGLIHDKSWNDLGEDIYTIDEMVDKMLDPHSDYPALAKILINPGDDDVWTMDR